jgi:hypothetical protein
LGEKVASNYFALAAEKPDLSGQIGVCHSENRLLAYI